MQLFQQKNLHFYLYMLLISPLCLEIALRILHYKPFQQQAYQIKSNPSFCILPHESLGFALQPGTFTVQINEATPYQVTHGTDSLRVSSLGDLVSSQAQIFLMGCSYTYGMGVDDSLTFAYKLQEKFPQYRFRNFGVPGYGNVQSYLQVLTQLQHRNSPKMIILNFADFHLERNVLSSGFRRDLFMGFARSHTSLKADILRARIPYIKTDSSENILTWCNWEQVYENWLGREIFASVNFLQGFSDRANQLTKKDEQGSLRLFEKIHALCLQHNIELLVTGLTQTDKTHKVLNALKSKGINTLDISLDLTKPEYTQLPHDSHPNSSAHRHYFKKISHYLAPKLEAHIFD